jgi:N,N'-diacetylbacillosaminyl-diphospho-undecaprenol alpha-1,3-N-acetylgalactosaminyltransferase
VLLLSARVRRADGRGSRSDPCASVLLNVADTQRWGERTTSTMHLGRDLDLPALGQLDRAPVRHARAATASVRKVGVICPDAFTALQYQRRLLVALKGRGFDVCVISPSIQMEDVHGLQAVGITHIPIQFERFIAPGADLRYLVRLYSILRAQRFEYVHSFNLKCHIYSSFAAWLARVPHIFGTIEGLGFSYTDASGLRRSLLVRLIDLLNTIACRLDEKVWFVNSDDLEQLVSHGIIARDKAVLIRSVGVDVSEYSTHSIDASKLNRLKSDLAYEEGSLVVSMVVARAQWSKGVREFVEAADRLARMHPQVRCVLLAPLDDSGPQAVPADYLLAAEQANTHFRWLSALRRDVRELLALSDVVTLPSYYREGVPKILLEAMSMGKPVVTTDNVGCRDVVEDGKTGLLVAVKDSTALAEALGKLVEDADARTRLGQCAREKVVREFADSSVVNRVMAELYGP